MPPVTQEQVNNKNMSLADNPANRIAQARANVDAGMTPADARRVARGVEPTIDAEQLATPVSPVTVPTPAVPNPNQGQNTQRLINNVATATQGFIESQSEEAKRLRELGNLLGEQEVDASGQRQQLNEQFGLPANLQRLQDLQTQLAQANTESQITQSRIGESPGQTLATAGREMTQEQRENAIRTAGVAAEAAVLQGNIQTAQTIINSAMQDYYQDRQLRNQNMINQMNFLQGIVDNQTSQLIQREQRQYEEDQRQIMRAESAVDAATESGYASPEDLKEIVRLAGDPQMQGDYARSVVARGAIEERMLENAIREGQLAVQQSSLASQALSRRKTLLEMGMLGDPDAIAQLGFDPGAEIRAAAEAEASEEAAVKSIQAEAEIDRLDRVMNDVTELLGNTRGLNASSGQFRNATISGFFQGGKGGNDFGDLFRFTPGVGNVMGAAQTRQDKDDFLAKAGTLLTGEGFEALVSINDRVRLTPITNAEVSLAFRTASDLQNAAIKEGSAEEGTQRITGFRMSEEEVRNGLADIYLAAQKAQEEIKAIEEYGYQGYLRLQELEREVTQ